MLEVVLKAEQQAESLLVRAPGVFASVDGCVAAADDGAGALANHVAHEIHGIAEVAVQLGHAVPIPRMLPHPGPQLHISVSGPCCRHRRDQSLSLPWSMGFHPVVMCPNRALIDLFILADIRQNLPSGSFRSQTLSQSQSLASQTKFSQRSSHDRSHFLSWSETIEPSLDTGTKVFQMRRLCQLKASYDCPSQQTWRHAGNEGG